MSRTQRTSADGKVVKSKSCLAKDHLINIPLNLTAKNQGVEETQLSEEANHSPSPHIKMYGQIK